MNKAKFASLCKLIRYNILTATTEAGSGHPTTSLSAVELMATLFFGGFLNYDLENPKNLSNDRVVFSKGHAAPLLYSLYQAAGAISYEELMSLRKFNSVLEGHPSPRFKYIDVASGSLGQGLSVGVGMAMGVKLRVKNQQLKEEPKIWVLLGDSEMAEGQIWEAMEIASYYKLNNLIGILDVNRLGQRGPTMLEWDLATYEKRVQSFGWKTIIVDDGHDLEKVNNTFNQAIEFSLLPDKKPVMIIAKTMKGKGVSFLENKDGWHGKPVPKDMLPIALKELGEVDLNVRGKVEMPKSEISNNKSQTKSKIQSSNIESKYKLGDVIATREAYGDALVLLGQIHNNLLVLDGETSNSTYAEKYKKNFPDRFFEMFIAEQNMISAALGLSKIGFNVYASSFAAFLTRTYDQLRIAQYSKPNVKLCGSHAGVSIGEDGPSQMALEDLSMVRSLLESIVLYPSDGVSSQKLTELMFDYEGISYIRTTREKTPVIYENNEQFKIGGSKIHLSKVNSSKSNVLIIGAGITLHESLKAQKQLIGEGIETVVMDCYSVKPIDAQSINQLAAGAKSVIVVEDHYPYGGLGEAVRSALEDKTMKQLDHFIHLSVKKIPCSGKPAELLHSEEIDAEAIVKSVKKVCG